MKLETDNQPTDVCAYDPDLTINQTNLRLISFVTDLNSEGLDECKLTRLDEHGPVVEVAVLCTFTRLLRLEALLIETYLNMEPSFFVDQTSLEVTGLEVRYRIKKHNEWC